MIKPKLKVLTDVQAKDGLEISYADIFSFDFLPENIKTHDLDGIRESIQTFGFVDPILVNKKTNQDVSGNGRLTVLRQMFDEKADCPKKIIAKRTDSGLKWFAPVVLLDLSEEDEEILAMKLNQTNFKGGIDNIKAFAILKRLKEHSEAKFEMTGYTAEDLERIQMLAKFHTQVAEMKAEKLEESESTFDTTKESDENICIELNRKWNVNLGDIFQIGKHRLICGDSTLSETYERLLDKKVRLVFSSPPYDNQRSYQIEGKIDWTALMNGVCASIFPKLSEPSDVIFNLGLIYDGEVKFYWNNWLEYCKTELKNPLFGLYVWDKLTGAAGEWKGRLAPAHEFFFHFSFGKVSANKWIEKKTESIERANINRTLRDTSGVLKSSNASPESGLNPFKVPDSVIRLNRETAVGIHTEGHPATFPIALPSFFLKTYTMIGDAVLEPFAGSGTTFLACEDLDRICYGVEISPNYCALICERMQRAYPKMEIVKL